MIEISINGVRGNALLDTGTFYTSIDKDLARISGTKIHEQTDIFFSDAAGNKSYASIMRADSIKIANYTLSQNKFYPVFENLDRTGTKHEMSYICVIGMDLLTQNNAVIDFGNKKLYLVK